MKHFLLISFFLISFHCLKSQDALFNQFDHAPLALNPALTGELDGRLRLNSLYRDHWRNVLQSDAFKTAYISADRRHEFSKNTYLGVGVSGIFDRAGSINFTNTGIGLNTSLARIIGNRESNFHVISIGVESKLASISSQGTQTLRYFDLSIGGLYKYQSVKGFAIEIGGSIFHINTPNISPLGTNELTRRISLYARAEIPVHSKVSILPYFTYNSQVPHEFSLIGNNVRFKLDEFNNLLFFELGYSYLAGLDFVNVGHGLRGTLRFKRFRLGIQGEIYPKFFEGARSWEFSFAYFIDKREF